VLEEVGYILVEPQLLSLEQTHTGIPVVGVAEDSLVLVRLVPPLVVPTATVMLVEVREA